VPDAKALYQSVILDHGKKPRNERKLERATASATEHNPLCGDRVTIHVDVQNARIEGISFEARGCMIAKASASLLTETVKGCSVDEARVLASDVERLETSGPLEPLQGAREFPARRACVTLAWHALMAAIGPSEAPHEA
jgi:nitrogen fixation NifU-like protein